MVEFINSCARNDVIEARDETVDGVNVITEFAGMSSMPVVDNDIFWISAVTGPLLKLPSPHRK